MASALARSWRAAFSAHPVPPMLIRIANGTATFCQPATRLWDRGVRLQRGGRVSASSVSASRGDHIIAQMGRRSQRVA